MENERDKISNLIKCDDCIHADSENYPCQYGGQFDDCAFRRQEQKLKMETFSNLCKPVQKWLQNNYCPMDEVVIDFDGFRVKSSNCSVPNNIH